MTKSMKHILVGGGTPVTSSLSGRELLINTDVTRFRVPATFTAKGTAAAEAAYMEFMNSASTWDTRRVMGKPEWQAITAALSCRTPATLAGALDPLAEALLASTHPKRWGGATPVNLMSGPISKKCEPRVAQVFFLLWREGCLLAPLAEARLGLFFADRKMHGGAKGALGPINTVVAQLRAVANHTQGAEALITRLLLSVHGIQDVGDLSSEVLALLSRAWTELDPEMQSAVDAIVPGAFEYTARSINDAVTLACTILATAQRLVFVKQPEIVARVPQSYFDVRPHRIRPWSGVHISEARDLEFTWIRREFPGFDEWQKQLAAYVATRSDLLDLRSQLYALRRSVKALLSSESPPATPTDACRQPNETARILLAELAERKCKDVNRQQSANVVRGFFDWLITVKERRVDGTLDQRLGNPVDLFPKFGKHTRPAQTVRAKMPSWLMQLAVEVIQGNDYEWPRKRLTDYREVVEDGEVTQVWSPVLAELTLLRFLLPIRGTQARLLGSGEGDTWVWVPPDVFAGAESHDWDSSDKARQSGHWVRNTSQWAPADGEDRALGLVRRMWDDEEGVHFNGLYISTNKTADKMKGWAELGYEIPWVSDEILSIYDRVLRFQARYNAPKAPKSRAELTGEATIIPSDVAVLMPKTHYLFRDAAHRTHSDEPVSTARVQNFWNEMLAEVERRCESSPDVPRNPDGSPLTLVEKWTSDGKASSVKYDLHSLRVTGISRLALGGCPLQVLMMLAGHATWIMSLYYVRMSPSEVRKALEDAEKRLERFETAELEEALSSVDATTMRAFQVATSAVGLEQWRDADVALMSSSELGLCPNGGTLCHVGGKPLSTAASSSSVHGPVPGLATNCQSCRFLVSGPQYLVGIVARLNALSVRVRATGDRLRATEERRRSLVDERRRAGDNVDAALLRRLRRAAAEVEAAEAQAEDFGERWWNLLRLFNRCLKALRELMRRKSAGEVADDRHLLVLNGAPDDVQVALRRCNDITLWNRVCFDSEVWDAVDATEPAARRGMRIDHLLAQSGRPAVFAGLSEEERIAVGNVFARWLETRLGPAGADEIYEGRRTLAEAGLLDDLDMVLPRSGVNRSASHLLPNAQILLPSVSAVPPS
ncbi:MAG: hypothetical protein HYV19_08875 [Gemmatimonadetes bacterium]|nr:hypothetical protein [Gemmatimonadota bacterium]